MSAADINFINMCRDILANGTDTQGEKVRPHWEDGTPAYTIKQFGVVNRYNLAEEFPAVTLRRTPIKSAVDEVLWIWQKKSNNVNDFGQHIWDSWADEDGSIGKAYGYQMAVKQPYRDLKTENILAAFPGSSLSDDMIVSEDGRVIAIKFDKACRMEAEGTGCLVKGISGCIVKNDDRRSGYWCMDQVDRVLYDLKTTPYSRRILTSIYAHDDLSEMNLYPCAYSMTFNVTRPAGSDKLVLNSILNQRSQDILAANAWNVAQYAALTHMFAQCCGMEVGQFVHVIADAHIYDRHVPVIKELIEREPHPAPKFVMNPEITDFYKFTKDDFRFEDYEFGPAVDKIPVAI